MEASVILGLGRTTPTCLTGWGGCGFRDTPPPPPPLLTSVPSKHWVLAMFTGPFSILHTESAHIQYHASTCMRCNTSSATERSGLVLETRSITEVVIAENGSEI